MYANATMLSNSDSAGYVVYKQNPRISLVPLFRKKKVLIDPLQKFMPRHSHKFFLCFFFKMGDRYKIA
jgi:hypothetical protein